MSLLGKLIFWDFKRGSWQYDVIVAAILAFIFLTPRAFFGDQPKAANIVMLPAHQGYLLLEPALLKNVPALERPEKATQLVRKRFKNQDVIDHVEPFYDQDTLTGYMAFSAK